MPHLGISSPQRKQLVPYQTNPKKSQSQKTLLLVTLWLCSVPHHTLTATLGTQPFPITTSLTPVTGTPSRPWIAVVTQALWKPACCLSRQTLTTYLVTPFPAGNLVWSPQTGRRTLRWPPWRASPSPSPPRRWRSTASSSRPRSSTSSSSFWPSK